MKHLDKFMKFGIDLLATVMLAAIVTLLTPIILNKDQEVKFNFVYIWIILVVLIVLLLWKIIHTHKNRFFSERFRNEKDAIPTIAKLTDNTDSKMCILSKVGTSIFFNFSDYTNALEKGRTVQVLVADPNDQQLIELMDRIYIKQTPISKRWLKMVRELQSQLELINEKLSLPRVEYSRIQSLLDGNKNGSEVYRALINASIIMWYLAQMEANRKLKEAGIGFHACGLDVRTYRILPDIKAWIFDEGCCVLGNYDALNLGRDNPIDLYQPKKKNGVEHWQFKNVLRIWEYKFSKSKAISLKDVMES